MCSPRGLTWLGISGSAEAFTEDARRPGRGSRLGDRGGGLWTNFEGSRCGAGPASRAGLGFGPGTAASGGSESPQRTGASVSRLGVGRMLVCGKQGRSSGLGCLSEVSSPAQTREEGPGVGVPTGEQTRSGHLNGGAGSREQPRWQGGGTAGRKQPGRKPSPWGWGHPGVGDTEEGSRESRAWGPLAETESRPVSQNRKDGGCGAQSSRLCGAPGRNPELPTGSLPTLPSRDSAPDSEPAPHPPAEGRTPPLPTLRPPPRDPLRARTSLTNGHPGLRWEVGQASRTCVDPGARCSRGRRRAPGKRSLRVSPALRKPS